MDAAVRFERGITRLGKKQGSAKTPRDAGFLFDG
jgi:hypothetical protein